MQLGLLLLSGLLAAQPIAAGHAKWSRKVNLEDELCNKKHPHITPLDKPVPLDFDGEAPKRHPRDYLKRVDKPYGKAAALWQEQLFKGDDADPNPEYRDEGEPEIEPKDGRKHTLIALYFPHPSPKHFKSKEVYLERIQRLAATEEQVVFYVQKDVADEVRKMRPGDKHWHIIDDYESVWDLPVNTFQKRNFMGRQRELFAEMRATGDGDWRPSKIYDDGFYSAVYNAKTWAVMDAVLRNPFGSTMFAYMDAGLLLVPELPEHPQIFYEDGKIWGNVLGRFLDPVKMERSIRLTQDTGVVFPEYVIEPHRPVIDINWQCFRERKFEWQDKYYLGGFYVGSGLGMLNYAVRYMATMDALDANDWYSGREEFVIPMVGARYPNTVYSMPVQRLPDRIADPKYGDATIRNWKYMMLSYSQKWGKDWYPAMRDPIHGRYCGLHTKYQPRQPDLAAGEH